MGTQRFTTLKRRRDFERVFKDGCRNRSDALVIVGLKQRQPCDSGCRFAFQLKRALGTAVKRNVVRRRLKSITRNLSRRFDGCWDVVIIVLPSAMQRKYQDLEHDLERAFERLHCFCTRAASAVAVQ